MEVVISSDSYLIFPEVTGASISTNSVSFLSFKASLSALLLAFLMEFGLLEVGTLVSSMVEMVRGSTLPEITQEIT